MVVVCSKGMVAGPGGTKAVAHHLHILLAAGLQLLADVIGCQRGKGTAEGMPCVQATSTASVYQLKQLPQSISMYIVQLASI
jgi:hypothetical protein